jgi:hypothetical protein
MTRLLIGVCVTLVCGVLLIDHVPTQAQSPRVRVVRQRAGVSITSLLLPDDEIVVIESSGHWQTIAPPESAREMLRQGVQRNDLSVVLEVTDIIGILEKDRSWIRTRVTGRVVELLMSRDAAAPLGAQLEIDYPWAGETRVGNVLVRAGELLRMQKGQRYFTFLKRNPETREWHIAGALLRVDGAKLASLESPESSRASPGPLHGLKYADVAKQVRRLAKELKVK